MTEVLDVAQGERFYAVNADCVEFAASLPDASVGFSVYSPPFAHLFVYSDSERDMGNVKDEAEFKALYRHLVREKFRITKPGRLHYSRKRLPYLPSRRTVPPLPSGNGMRAGTRKTISLARKTPERPSSKRRRKTSTASLSISSRPAKVRCRATSRVPSGSSNG